MTLPIVLSGPVVVCFDTAKPSFATSPTICGEPQEEITLDVHCCNCGEPWDQYDLRHELPEETPDNLAVEGWSLGLNRLVVLRCPAKSTSLQQSVQPKAKRA